MVVKRHWARDGDQGVLRHFDFLLEVLPQLSFGFRFSTMTLLVDETFLPSPVTLVVYEIVSPFLSSVEA